MPDFEHVEFNCLRSLIEFLAKCLMLPHRCDLVKGI